MNKRLKILVAAAAAVGVVAVGGIAYAAYARTNDTEAVGNAESFKPLTVSGQWVGGPGGAGLLPGEAGDVRITVSVSADNTVNAKVASIVAQPISAGDISGVAADKKEDCKKALQPAGYEPTALILAKGATNVQLTLKSAVLFAASATVDCEGMSFKTKWTVTFVPDRATTGLTGSGGQVSVTPKQ